MLQSSRLLAALAYPRTVDDYLQLVAPLYSTREIRARVVATRRETADTSTLVLRPNARWHGHRAGQHVLLGVELHGARKTRCFSIASAPESPRERVEITIKARAGGEVTPALVEGLPLGTIVTLSEPRGDFVLPEPTPERVLLVSGGSGITPVMSMLRSLLARGHRGEVAFVHYARTDADVIFRAELEHLQQVAPRNFRVRAIADRFDARSLAATVADFEQWPTWACGPLPFLSAVEDAFAARGARDRVHVEEFSLAADVDASLDGGEVTFARSRTRAEGKGPLLAIAERAGLSPASGCRMGICMSCTCRKISGKTRDLRTGEVSSDENVDIQACVSAPVGPVEIDL